MGKDRKAIKNITLGLVMVATGALVWPNQTTRWDDALLERALDSNRIWFLPENDLNLQPGLLSNDMTEETFDFIIQRARDFYRPVVRSHGAILRIDPHWGDSRVNASATRALNLWVVQIYGGLARRPEITADGLALVLCHELGHHLGGFPKSRQLFNLWAALEGQSDYFASLSCAKELMRPETEVNAGFRETVEPAGQALCDAVYGQTQDQNLCYRLVMAAKSIGEFLEGVGEVSFEEPDTSIVDSTLTSHPAGQCRMDTLVQGALCPKEFDTRIIPNTEQQSAQYACTHAEGRRFGARPLCWYKPTLPCDEDAFDPYCADQVAISCENGQIVRIDCAAQDAFCGYDEDQDKLTCIETADPCQGETPQGRCSDDTLIWCEDEQVQSEDCAVLGLVCGYDPVLSSYACLEPQPDPCQGETERGRCAEDTLIWCEDEQVQTRDCTAEGKVCGLDTNQDRFACLDAQDPCQGETEEGRCEGRTVIWCEDGEVHSQTCRLFQTCKWNVDENKAECDWYW